MRLRWSFRLNVAAATLDYTALFASTVRPMTSTVNVHHFEEVINGREFKIEVSPVAPDKWRAQLARKPGGSAATMPFYGKTPREAAGQLSRWLCLAHGNTRPQI
jgi:tartrate dehydratase alpha subunit/fumarate hydratase class I-like protein